MIAAKQQYWGGAAEWKNPYVTDGLVAMWDGEWNAGPGKHDANATEWKDLVGGSANWQLNNCAFGADHLANGELGYATLTQAQSEAIFGTSRSRTVQICFRSITTTAGARGLFAANSSANITAITYVSKLILGNYQSAEWNGSGAAFSGTLSIGLKLNLNGGPFGSGHPVYGSQNGYGAVENYAMLFHFRPQLTNDNSLQICCIRVYNGAISDDTIAANYAIDKERFNLT